MKIDIFNRYRMSFYISRTEKRYGVCSPLYKSDKHILLWDFDDTPLIKVIDSLLLVQLSYKLPTIYILESSKNRYHAYCFVSKTLQEIIHILSCTQEIDLEYLRLGMVRGYYTLRFSPRKGETFKLIKTLKSDIPEETSPFDVTINQYYTTNKGDKN